MRLTLIFIVGTTSLSGCQFNTLPNYPVASSSAASLDFWKVADASCELALELGVVESGQGYVQFMVPKDEAIEGYSAAYWDKTSDEVGLIWETDALAACGASVSRSMAEESGGELSWEIVNLPADSFEVTQSYPEFEPVTVIYETSNGVFSSTALPGDESTKLIIEYGPVPENYLKLLERAIDEFKNQ